MSLRPPASVTVRRSSRCDGYSWSGATNEPPATPTKSCSGCVWQFDGQWWRISDQLNADAGSVPCCGSVAEPENETVLPTRQVVPAVGVTIDATGGEFPAVIVTASVSEAPGGSVTRSCTL